MSIRKIHTCVNLHITSFILNIIASSFLRILLFTACILCKAGSTAQIHYVKLFSRASALLGCLFACPVCEITFSWSALVMSKGECSASASIKSCAHLSSVRNPIFREEDLKFNKSGFTCWMSIFLCSPKEKSPRGCLARCPLKDQISHGCRLAKSFSDWKCPKIAFLVSQTADPWE